MIKQCTDKNIISKIINHPKTRNWLVDDGSINCNEIIINPNVLYLVDETENGVIRVDPMNSSTCYVHIATTPKLWGSGHTFVKEAISWGFKNTRYLKIVALIPSFNFYTIQLVRDLGFKEEGLLKKSFMKNWKLHDQLIFSLLKGEI